MKRPSRHHQRGGTTLVVTLVLTLVLWLAVAAAHRGLLFEHKTSVNQYKSAQAFEAAEAGLEWAIAQLNSNAPIGTHCQASGNAGDTSFKQRYLGESDDDGAFTPRIDAGSGTTLQAACVKGSSAWSCSCPASGTPSLPEASSGHAVSFAIRFTAGDEPGVLQLSSRGCSGGNALCLASDSTADARALMQVAVARIPGLDSEPAAALTVRGAMHATSALTIQHINAASGGMTVHSGGAIDAPNLQLVSAPGAPAAASTFDHDAALSALSAPGLFASLFRMDKSHWKSQPVVKRIDCRSACDRALSSAIENGGTLVWLDGGLQLDTALTLGSPQRPVLLVADGPVRLNAAAIVHGLVYSTSPDWTDTAGATVQGAVVIEGDMQGHGNTQIRHDAAVLKQLHRHSGTFARVPGSWRDF
jgi:Tfp pilus assembly protein PilX